MEKKSIEPTLAQLLAQGAPHTRNHTTTSPPFPQKTREIHDSCLFSPVTSSTIPTSGISKSPKVRFLTAWSSFSCFTVYQPAAKNSMQYSALQIPWNLELTLRLHLLEWYRHCPRCLRTLSGIFGGISRKTCQHSPKYVRKFPGTFGDIPRNVRRHSSECLAAFPGIFEYIPRNVWRHSPEYNIPHIPRIPRIPFPVPVFLVLYIAHQTMYLKRVEKKIIRTSYAFLITFEKCRSSHWRCL